MDDWTLLRDHVENESEPAFRELVRRHVDMVYVAAVRQLRYVHLAQDVIPFGDFRSGSSMSRL